MVPSSPESPQQGLAMPQKQMEAVAFHTLRAPPYQNCITLATCVGQQGADLVLDGFSTIPGWPCVCPWQKGLCRSAWPEVFPSLGWPYLCSHCVPMKWFPGWPAGPLSVFPVPVTIWKETMLKVRNPRVIGYK